MFETVNHPVTIQNELITVLGALLDDSPFYRLSTETLLYLLLCSNGNHYLWIIENYNKTNLHSVTSFTFNVSAPEW